MTTFLSLLLNFIGLIPVAMCITTKLDYGSHSLGLMTLIPFFYMLSESMSNAKKDGYMTKMFGALVLLLIVLNSLIYSIEVGLNALLEPFFVQHHSGNGISFYAPTIFSVLCAYITYPLLRLGLSICFFKMFKVKILPRLVKPTQGNE